MIARAPGKVVLSGAYAVLDGAPAIVTAVDRYVVADSERAAELVTPEVRAAIGDAGAPWFDASALRAEGRKLGLGSSAAILVASLAARELARRGELDDAALCAAVLEPALVAHRVAQGGGSGIDVAASARGGTLIATRSGDGARELALESVTLPAALHVEIWASGTPASTPALVARVRALVDKDALMAAQAAAAERAASAAREGDAARLLAALDAQHDCLARLGATAGADIVTGAVARLAALAREADATVLPAGAGGGDVALYAGLAPPRQDLLDLAARLDHRRLDLRLGAQGVHAAARKR